MSDFNREYTEDQLFVLNDIASREDHRSCKYTGVLHLQMLPLSHLVSMHVNWLTRTKVPLRFLAGCHKVARVPQQHTVLG